MAIKKFKIEASEQAKKQTKKQAKKPVKASDGDWDKAVIGFIDTIPNLPEQGKVISKTYKGWPIVIVGLGNGKCLYHSYLQKANAASDIQFIRGLIKRGDAPEKAVENLGFKTYTRGDVEGACGGKKSVKSAAGKKRWGLYSDFGQRILNETFDSKREAQKAFREYGYTKDSEAWIEEVDETAVGKFDKKPANSACGGKKSVKSAAKRSVKCAETNADLERAKRNIVDGYYSDSWEDEEKTVEEYFESEDLNRVPILYTTIGDTDEHEYQLYADLINPKIIVEIDGKTIYEDKFPSIGALADDLEDFDWDNWYSYYLRYVPDEIVYGEEVNGACGGKKSVRSSDVFSSRGSEVLDNGWVIQKIRSKWYLMAKSEFEKYESNLEQFPKDLMVDSFPSKESLIQAYLREPAYKGMFEKAGYSLDKDWNVVKNRKSVKSSARRPARRSVKAADSIIKRYSDVVPKEDRKYWYFTTHGLGPGMIPKGINVLKVQEGQNRNGTWGDFILLDAILNTDELKQYDLIELAPKDVNASTKRKPMKKSVKASASAKRRAAKRITSAIIGSDKIVMNIDGKEVYEGRVEGLADTLTPILEKDTKLLDKFEKWCEYYTKSIDTNSTASDIAYAFAKSVKHSMEDTDSLGFYVGGGVIDDFDIEVYSAANKDIDAAKNVVKASKYYEITDRYNDEVGRADTEDEARELAKKLIRENDVDHYDIFWVDTDPDSTDDTSYIDTVYADKPFSVEGYFETNFRGLSDSDTFYELRDALDYAQELLGKGLSVRMECENAGGRLEITPDEYEEFMMTEPEYFEDLPKLAEWLSDVRAERMDSYQGPWLDNWQYNTDIGMSTKYAKRGKKPVKADFNDIEDIEDFYDEKNFDSTKALGAFNSDTAPYDVNTTVAEYITDNYGIYAESVSYVEYNGPGDWVVDMSQSGQAVADDFVYFLSEKDYDLSLKLYGESETDASGYDMAKYYGDSAIHGNDFQFQFYPAQNQWSAPQVDVDINELIQIGLTQEEANRVVDLVAEYEQNYISICQDINYYIESFLKELSEEEVKASTGVKAALGNKNKTDYASNPIYELDKYVKDLAEGVAAAAGITLTYQVSDEAITFIDGDGTAVFIQPISEITPEPDDLENDIQELVSAIQYEDSDNPEYWPTDTAEDDPDYATRAVQMSVDDELEPVMGEGEDIGYGIDSYGETIDESTVNELYRMAERDILPKTELAKIDPYVSIDEDSWDFYFGGISNTGMMGVVKFYIHFKLTSDNIDLNEFVIPEARLYPDFKYYTASLDFDIYTENGKVTDVVLEIADIYKSDNSYDTYQSDKFKEAFNVEAIENYIEKLAAPAVEEIYNAVSNL